MEDLGIGKLVLGTAFRDAIHIPVILVTAGRTLQPGDKVAVTRTVTGYIAHLAGEGEAVGVVDPFLKENVHEGQAFWLFVRPGTVAGLRHAWRHPAFTTELPKE